MPTDLDILKQMFDRAGIPYKEQRTGPTTVTLTQNRRYFAPIFTFQNGKLVSIENTG